MAVIFVPRLMDETQLNPQNKNAQAILTRWRRSDARCRTLSDGPANAEVTRNPLIRVHPFWPGRAWLVDLFRQYFRSADLIFYPGGHPVEFNAMRWRRRLGMKVPIVATVEGLLGNPEREKEYSEWAGHEVFCQHVDARGNRIWDEIFEQAVHVIAISPFLAEMSKRRYGDKFSVIPLGIDTSIFHDCGRTSTERLHVVSAGRVAAHKRPELMLQLAEQNPQADFTWFGDGPLTADLIQQAAKKQIWNVDFPGPVPPHELAASLRKADIFIMPSKSEGVPKVTQEAAACGLAQVVFGFYEAPTVIDNKNGFVVWNDQQFCDRVTQLLNDRELTSSFGRAGAKLARENWDWDTVAKKWQDTICQFLPT